MIAKVSEVPPARGARKFLRLSQARGGTPTLAQAFNLGFFKDVPPEVVQPLEAASLAVEGRFDRDKNTLWLAGCAVGLAARRAMRNLFLPGRRVFLLYGNLALVLAP